VPSLAAGIAVAWLPTMARLNQSRRPASRVVLFRFCPFRQFRRAASTSRWKASTASLAISGRYRRVCARGGDGTRARNGCRASSLTGHGTRAPLAIRSESHNASRTHLEAVADNSYRLVAGNCAVNESSDLTGAGRPLTIGTPLLKDVAALANVLSLTCVRLAPALRSRGRAHADPSGAAACWAASPTRKIHCVS